MSNVLKTGSSNPDEPQNAAAHAEPTPATTLPWLFNDECGRIEGHEGSIIFYVAGSSLNPRVEQDVYHTLHAVHSYRRLVSALKESIAINRDYLKEWGPCDHSVNICFCADIRAVDALEAVLKELGE